MATINYIEARSHLQQQGVQRALTRIHGDLPKMYKSAGKFSSSSQNFRIIHSQVMTVQLSNFYQAYIILEDDTGKRFKHISNRNIKLFLTTC